MNQKRVVANKLANNNSILAERGNLNWPVLLAYTKYLLYIKQTNLTVREGNQGDKQANLIHVLKQKVSKGMFTQYLYPTNTYSHLVVKQEDTKKEYT